MSKEQAPANDPSLTSRRGFIHGVLWAALTSLAAAVLYPVVRFLSPPRVPEAARGRVLAGKVSEMTGEEWKLFPFGQEPGILVQVNPGEFRAFQATCTHLDCTVQFHSESGRIWCPCHNGFFDLTGRNVAGPPPHPLDAYEVQVVDDDIFVTRSSA